MSFSSITLSLPRSSSLFRCFSVSSFYVSLFSYIALLVFTQSVKLKRKWHPMLKFQNWYLDLIIFYLFMYYNSLAYSWLTSVHFGICGFVKKKLPQGKFCLVVQTNAAAAADFLSNKKNIYYMSMRITFTVCPCAFSLRDLSTSQTRHKHQGSSLNIRD